MSRLGLEVWDQLRIRPCPTCPGSTQPVAAEPHPEEAAEIQKHNQQRATASISVVSVSWMTLDDTGCHWMPLARNQKPCTNSVNASALEHAEGLCAPTTSSTSPYPLRSVILCPQILSWRNSPKPCLGSLLAKEMDDWPRPPL